MSTQTVRYCADIRETYRKHVEFDVPLGESPETYLAQLCNIGKEGATMDPDDHSRVISDVYVVAEKKGDLNAHQG